MYHYCIAFIKTYIQPRWCKVCQISSLISFGILSDNLIFLQNFEGNFGPFPHLNLSMGDVHSRIWRGLELKLYFISSQQVLDRSWSHTTVLKVLAVSPKIIFQVCYFKASKCLRQLQCFQSRGLLPCHMNFAINLSNLLNIALGMLTGSIWNGYSNIFIHNSIRPNKDKEEWRTTGSDLWWYIESYFCN